MADLITSSSDQTYHPRTTYGHAPVRWPNSVRRTSSIDVSWPEGREGAMQMDGRARDIFTPGNGHSIQVRAEDDFVARVDMERTIQSINTNPTRKKIGQLVGERGGGHLRKVLQEIIPEERANASPLYLILDDISGISLISGWAWSQWDPEWQEKMKQAKEERSLSMEGVCIGFRPGSNALNPDFDFQLIADAPAPDLRNPKDPEGWHAFTDQQGVGMRRARRIDVWQVNNQIKIDAAFQDSASSSRGGRMVLHEYHLTASADPKTLTLQSIEAHPKVLPFPECTSAPAQLSGLKGTAISSLRETVLDQLSGTSGCTHLNDALRALAEVPALVDWLLTRRH